MTGDRHHLRAVAFGGVAALAAISCTWRGPRTTTTTTTRAQVSTTSTTRATTTTTHGGHDHATPDRLNHPPTAEQKAAALKFVDETRAAYKADGYTAANLKDRGYINIGDGVHWVNAQFTGDKEFLNPHRIESFAVLNNQIAAAMYVYNPKGINTTLDDVPDLAGNWTVWHGHRLPYRSADPTSPDYLRLGADANGVMHWRNDSPMIHVWMQPNRCGPWASAGVGEGSCITELANY